MRTFKLSKQKKILVMILIVFVVFVLDLVLAVLILILHMPSNKITFLTNTSPHLRLLRLDTTSYITKIWFFSKSAQQLIDAINTTKFYRLCKILDKSNGNDTHLIHYIKSESYINLWYVKGYNKYNVWGSFNCMNYEFN